MAQTARMADTKKLIAIIPGNEAATVAGLVKMFTAIKRRPPTDQELAEFEAGRQRLENAGRRHHHNGGGSSHER